MKRLKIEELFAAKPWSRTFPGLGGSWEGAAWCALHLSRIGRFDINDEFISLLRKNLTTYRYPSVQCVGIWNGVGGNLRLADLAAELDSSFDALIPLQLKRIETTKQKRIYNDYYGGFPSLLMGLAGMRRKSFPKKLLMECFNETTQALKINVNSKKPVYIGVSHGLAGLLMAAEVGGEVFSLRFDRRLLDQAFDRIMENQISLEKGGALWLPRTGDTMESAGHLMRNSFCHGAAGIALALHTCHVVSGKNKYKKSAESAIKGSLELGNSIVSFCCGTSGQRQILIEMYRQNGQKKWLNIARKMNSAKTDIKPGLLTGHLGDVYLEERLRAPGRLPLPTFEWFPVR